MTLEEIAEEALKLPTKERADLAAWLLRSLDVPEHQVSDEEVRRRAREADDDPSVMITYDEWVAGRRSSL